MLCLKADMLKLMATIFKKDQPQAEFFKKALKFELDETSFVDTVNEQFEYEILCRYDQIENFGSILICSGSTRSRRRRWRRRRGERKLLHLTTGILTTLQVAADQQIDLGPRGDSYLPFMCSPPDLSFTRTCGLK